jgi:5S rRNA maturation endonuclease (ribonuclease M5)
LKALAARVESKSFQARLDAETVAVYNALLASEHSSVAAAQEAWATWHIDPAVVAEQRSVLVTDPHALGVELLDRFGADLLVDSGIAGRLDEKQAKTRDMHGAGIRFMFSEQYPLVEPCIGPSGVALDLRFRAWGKQRDRIAAHKAGNGPYVPAMLSLRGSTPDHLVGYGLERLGQIPATTVYVVEGFKDVLAARTMGAEAFGLPGTGVLPPEKVVRFLADQGHTLLVALDGDEAGVEARAKVIEHLTDNGFPADRLREKTDMPAGMDVADILAARVVA